MTLTGGEDDAGGDRNFVTALARGLDVLRCFRPGEEGLTNQEIAARTGLPKATVSRLTYTLCRLGYLQQLGRSGAYGLGAGVLELGFGVLAGMEMSQLAREEMRQLCEGPNPHVTAALGERHRLQVVFLAVQRARDALSVTMHVGHRVPLFTSSMGRAMLAGLGPAQREALIAQAIAENPEQAGTIHAGAAAAVESFARHGFATSFGEWRGEVNGIAVPVPSLNGDRLYALNIGGPAFLAPSEALVRDYGPRLVAAGRALSRQVGQGA